MNEKIIEKFKPIKGENSKFHKVGNFLVFSPFLFVPLFIFINLIFDLENFLNNNFRDTIFFEGNETLEFLVYFFVLSPFLWVLFYAFFRIFILDLKFSFWINFVYKFISCFFIFFSLLYSGLGYIIIVFLQFTLFKRDDAEKMKLKSK